jgi:Na+-translocating ferredoxin:NAD+ oxidoreductase subunit B
MEPSVLINAAAIFGALGAVLAAALRGAQPQAGAEALSERIDALLPQTQCGQCGHPGCRPYAQAMAQGEAINRCPPGGATTIAALADLLDTPPLPLDGISRPKAVAFIREEECIGCTKCIQACPVDAIVGATKLMHTVIAAECTGCDLCVEPCPVDCIEMRPLPQPDPTVVPPSAQECIRCGLCVPECPVALLSQQLYWSGRAGDNLQLHALRLDTCIECRACEVVCPSRIPLVSHFQAAKSALRSARMADDEARHYRMRFDAHNVRQQRIATERAERRQTRAATIPVQNLETPAPNKQDEIRAAIARAKAKKTAAQQPPPH